jgi:hypothetical protein
LTEAFGQATDLQNLVGVEGWKGVVRVALNLAVDVVQTALDPRIKRT